MADLSRLYDFVSGDVIRSSEVDAEFNQLVARSNVHNALTAGSSGLNSVYKRLAGYSALLTSGAAAATRLFDSSTLASNPASSAVVQLIYLDDADYTVAGLTAKLRVRGMVTTNATVPTLNFTFGLYPITAAGAADVLTLTAGTVVSGSTALVASPAASNPGVVAVSTDFNVPADGPYALGVVTSGALTANARCLLSVQLQTRSV